MKHNLLPLTKIVVGKSKTKGRGVFAAQDLEAKELIEEAHFIISGRAKSMQDKELARYVFSLFYDESLSSEENGQLSVKSFFRSMIDDEDIQKSLTEEMKDFGYEDTSSIFSTAIVLGFGMIYNHSEHYNVDWLIDYEDFVFKFITNRPVPKGDELFTHYGNAERKDLI